MHLLKLKNMSIKKQFLKSKPVCKVTFRIGTDVISSAKKVQLLGDFNSWDKKNPAMKKLKTGEFTETIELETGKEYQYKYLIDGKNWQNDNKADKYAPNIYSGTNSVVII